jgi:fibronectin-binding autotransporter adhesin
MSGETISSGTDISLVSQSGTVIGSNQYYGIVLSVPSTQNPATIAAGVYVTNQNGGDAVYGAPSFAWTVTNLGTVDITGSNGADGIHLASGGFVTNGASGNSAARIEAYLNGIEITGAAGTIVNYGTIEGTGASSTGIALQAGGNVINKAGGTISGYDGGVDISGAAGTVVNYGSIAATGDGLNTGAVGVDFADAPGTLVNRGTISSATSFDYFGAGVYLGAGGSVDNFGTIEGTGSDNGGILVGVHASGAAITNEQTGLIRGNHGVYVNAGSGTVVNYGIIDATEYRAVRLGGGGSVANSGLIEGYYGGVYLYGSAGIVVNHGTIHSLDPFRDGVYLGAGGTVSNAGFIGGLDGVDLRGGGTVTNSGTIAGYGYYNVGGIFAGFDYSAGAVVVTNTGTVTSTAAGIYIRGGGSVTNGGTAASFLGSGNRLIDDPGAVFTGIVYGGTGNDTLELASAAATGTLSGLGTNFTGFQNVVVDPGAVWQISDAAALSPATFTNDGTIVVTAGSLDFGAVGEDIGDRGVIDIGRNGLAVFDGAVAAGQTVAFTGTSAQADLADAAGFSGAVTNFQAGDTIDFEGVVANGTNYAGGVLTLTDNGAIVAELTLSTDQANPVFVLGTDGSGGTDVTLQPGHANIFSGTYHYGIVLDDAATENPATITATGYVTNRTGSIAVLGTGGYVWTVTNYGTIENTGIGVYLTDGGMLTNSADPGYIQGINNGVEITGGAGTIDNGGTIVGENGGGIVMQAGGTVGNSGLIRGAITGVYINGAAGSVTNSGTIEAATTGNNSNAVILIDGGYIYNTGVISDAGHGIGDFAIQIGLNAAGDIVNGHSGSTAGLIEAYHIAIITGAAGGPSTVLNFGTIETTGTYNAISFRDGGAIINEAGGLITGLSGGIVVTGAAGTVENYGTIEGSGNAGSGVYLGDGGGVNNNATIAGATNGVLLNGNNGASLTNSGIISGNIGILVSASDTGTNNVVNDATIVGYGGTALQFAGGTDTLVIDPSAVFFGSVVGDGSLSTLELAAGSGTGTVALGSAFTGFGNIKVDAGAVWQISDARSGAPILTNDGTVDISGHVVFDNVGQDAQAHGTINLAARATAVFDGTVAAGQKFVFTSSTGTLRLEDASAFSGKIAGFAAGDLIDVVESRANGFSFAASFAHHRLTVTYFGVTIASLKLAGKFKTSDFALTADRRGGVYVSLGTPSRTALSRASHGFGGGQAASAAAAAPAFTPFGAAGSLHAASLPTAGDPLLQNPADPFNFWTIQN